MNVERGPVDSARRLHWNKPAAAPAVSDIMAGALCWISKSLPDSRAGGADGGAPAARSSASTAG